MKYHNKKTPNKKESLFWKRKFMQVLEAMHDHELTWAKPHWADYGITSKEAEVISLEFSKQQKWRENQKNRSRKQVVDDARELGFEVDDMESLDEMSR